MTASAIALEDLERDALTELVNIGVSRAASSLRIMVGNQVLLSVPSVEVVSRADAAILIHEREAGQLVAVRQGFTGAFSGHALLIFPEANSLELVRAVTGAILADGEIADMEQEALNETANIVLNSCLASMANMLQRPLSMSLPEIMRGSGQGLFESGGASGPDAVVLFLYINFAVNDRDIRGYIAMLMDMPSLEVLRGLVNEFIAKVIGDEWSAPS